LVGIFGTAVAGFVTLLVERLGERMGLRGRRDAPSFNERVEAAASALRDASATVSQLEREIQERQEQVGRLQEQQKLLELSKEQILAVSHELQADALRESRRAVRIGVAASAFFFLAGVVVTLAIQ
jgi:hypothetical protein